VTRRPALFQVDPGPLPARFDGGACPVCKLPIFRGQYIVRDEKIGWAHLQCRAPVGAES